jgi:hypothetical protein
LATNIITFNATVTGNVTLPNPVLYPGQTLTFYNTSGGSVTVATHTGTVYIQGPSQATSTTTTLAIANGAFAQLISDGTNWLYSGGGAGGPIVGTTGTFSSTLAANGASGITTTQTTFPIATSTATTINIGTTNATTVNIGVSGTVQLGTSGATTTTVVGGAIAGNVLKIAGTAASTTTAITTDVTSGTFDMLQSVTGSVRIGSSGNVILGTSTSASTTAQVGGAITGNILKIASTAAGTINYTSDVTTGTVNFLTGLTTATVNVGSTAGGRVSIAFNQASSGTGSGALVVAGGVGVGGTLTATTITETSSIVFKENINPITDALDKILHLVGVTYDRKDGSYKDEPGFIAEDVEKIIPEVVTKNDNGDIYGIRYTKIIAYLVESIKTLKSEIDELKTR